MQEQIPVLILAGPAVVLAAALVLRVGARRWPGTDHDPAEARR